MKETNLCFAGMGIHSNCTLFCSCCVTFLFLCQYVVWSNIIYVLAYNYHVFSNFKQFKKHVHGKTVNNRKTVSQAMTSPSFSISRRSASLAAKAELLSCTLILQQQQQKTWCCRLRRERTLHSYRTREWHFFSGFEMTFDMLKRQEYFHNRMQETQFASEILLDSRIGMDWPSHLQSSPIISIEN